MQKRCHPPENICRSFTKLVVKDFKTNINKMVYQVRLIQVPRVKVVYPEMKTSATFRCSQHSALPSPIPRSSFALSEHLWKYSTTGCICFPEDNVGSESMSRGLNRWNTQAFGLAKKRETARTSNLTTSFTGRRSKSSGNNSVGRNSDPFSALPSCSLINWRNRLDSVASGSEATSGVPECVSMSQAGEDASFSDLSCTASDSTSPSDLPSEAVVQIDGSGRPSAVFQAAAYAFAHCSVLELFGSCSRLSSVDWHGIFVFEVWHSDSSSDSAICIGFVSSSFCLDDEQALSCCGFSAFSW